MRRRIVIYLALLLGLCLVGDAIALLALDQSIGRSRELAESQRLQAMRATLSRNGLEVERNLLGFLVDEPDSRKQLRESIGVFRNSLRRCFGCHHDPVISAQLTEVRGSLEDWLDRSETLFEAEDHSEIGPDERSSIELVDLVVQKTTGMFEQAHRALEAESDEVKSIVHGAWVILCGTLVAVLIAGGIVAFHLQQRLTKPLSGLLELTQRERLGSGERPRIAGDSEFRVLGDAFCRAYEERENAQQSAMEAQKMAAIGQLAAGVAHEVLNPLTGISCLVQLMREESSEEEQTRRFDLIMEHIRRISNILREFQDFSQPTGGERWSSVDVAGLLDQTAELLGYDSRCKGVRVFRNYASNLEVIRADSDRLALVFTNILLNALDALREVEAEERVLTIEAWREDKSLSVRFTDNGPGMTPQAMESAFDPFFTTKSAGTGTGLGLWVCYEAIHAHEGRITLDHRQGGGLVVTVEIPYSEASAAI